jgi:hypothetical protein
MRQKLEMHFCGPLSTERVTLDKSDEKFAEFSQWEEAKKLKLEAKRRQQERDKLEECTFKPKVGASPKRQSSLSFEERMEHDTERRKDHLEKLKKDRETKVYGECTYTPQFVSYRRKSSRPPTPRRSLQEKSMSLEEIISLARN